MDTKNDESRMLSTMKRLVPGTIYMRPCDNIGECLEKKKRSCDDLRNLCVSSKDDERVIGGISFIFDGGKGFAGNIDMKNGIIIHRYGQEGTCIKGFMGNNFEDVMKKLEKDDTIKEITERTKFVKDEQKEAEESKIVDNFRKYIDKSDRDVCILLTRKNSSGEYDSLDKKLIKVAKEKEKETGKKIKIVDESELDRKTYVYGIESKKVMNELKLDVERINNTDADRVHIFIIPTKKNPGISKDKNKKEIVGILAINSIEDDISGDDDKKDEWIKYFTEKYKGLSFISKEKFKK